VTDYVREGYNQAIQEKKHHVGFLMILMQRLVVSSTRAIRTTAAVTCEQAGPDAKAEALLEWIYKLQSEEVEQLRHEIMQIRESSAIYGLCEEPDAQAADRLRSHPLPHWVEQMTVSYINSHGGTATRKNGWWEIAWPEEMTTHAKARAAQKSVFNTREANHLTDSEVLTLENSRVRGLVLNLPQMAEGQPLPCVFVNGLPSTVKGFWGLFEIRLQAGLQIKTHRLRIPMVRRGYVSVFLNEEGGCFYPRPSTSGMRCRQQKHRCKPPSGRMNPLPPIPVCRNQPSRLGRRCLTLCNRHTQIR
jgi:hypothetical protein